MRKTSVYLLLSILIFACNKQVKQDNSNINSIEKEIDQYISEASEEYGIVGSAVAVVKDEKIIYKKYYGKSNMDYNISISDSTLFQLFSTSKIFSSVAIHKLVEEEKLTLDDKLEDYLKDLPKSWRNIKIKNLLTHSSGLPDIRFYDKDSLHIAKEKIYKDSIQFVPGIKFAYNQTNFWLLNRILKKISGNEFPSYILKTQFDKTKAVTNFNGNFSHIVINRATNYSDYPKQGILRETDYIVPEFLYGASGQNITLDEFIKWNSRFENNELINEDSKSRIFKQFDYEQHFDFGYGWGIVKLNDEPSYGFTGSKSTGYRIFPNKNMSIIFLTNGSKRGMSIDKRINRIARIVDSELSKDVEIN